MRRGHAGRVPLPGNGHAEVRGVGRGDGERQFRDGPGREGQGHCHSASCSAVLVPEADAGARDARPYRIFLYFPPKAGKFEGYADEVSLMWDGVTFTME